MATHRICNLGPSRDTEEDWRFEHAVRANAVAAPAALPASVDLRAAWWDIGDQESTGSCVGWGSTDGRRPLPFRQGRQAGSKLKSCRRALPGWHPRKPTRSPSRPETFIEGAGTSLKAAVDILRKYGAAPETLLPFHIATNMYLGDENTFFATVATRRIASYFNLQRNLTNWRSWLATHGPILVGVNVDATWDNATATHGKLDTFQPSTVRGGHARASSATRATIALSCATAGVPRWGDHGFAYASEAYINAAFYNESYGVTL